MRVWGGGCKRAHMRARVFMKSPSPVFRLNILYSTHSGRFRISVWRLYFTRLSRIDVF